MHDIDFNRSDIQVLSHPEYEKFIPRILEGLRDYDLRDHFILFSSGTTSSELKGYALSKAALFANAQATIDHFNLTANDVWGLSLPLYHVGGLSVIARARLLNNKIIDIRKWDPDQWIKALSDVTITTIVPTQLYDLVKRKLTPPKDLRYLIVGGDLLSSSLEKEALKLGWPVIRTFGMTEVCSQLASTKFPGEEEKLEVLPIHQLKTDQENQLWVKSPALFTLQFRLSTQLIVSPLEDLTDNNGFYKTLDRVILNGSTLEHLGRMGDEIKIAGHLVNLNQLKSKLSSFLLQNNIFNEMEFLLENDVRKAHKLVLLTLPQHQHFSQEISQIINPVKLDEIRLVQQFERTSLGKLKRNSIT